MARQDFWNRQRGRERSWDVRDLREDFGQADYSRDYGYDPHTRTAVRRDEMRERIRDEPVDERGYRANERALDRDRRYDEPRQERRLDDPRTWFGGGHRDQDRDGRDDRYEVRDRDRHGRSRYGSDEQIWREVVERLETDRRLDPRDIEVDVRGGEVTLRGVVEDRDQKRRAEDLADVGGVVDVHNHLTIRNRYAGESRGSSWRRNLGLSG